MIDSMLESDGVVSWDNSEYDSEQENWRLSFLEEVKDMAWDIVDTYETISHEQVKEVFSALLKCSPKRKTLQRKIEGNFGFTFR